MQMSTVLCFYERFLIEDGGGGGGGGGGREASKASPDNRSTPAANEITRRPPFSSRRRLLPPPPFIPVVPFIQIINNVHQFRCKSALRCHVAFISALRLEKCIRLTISQQFQCNSSAVLINKLNVVILHKSLEQFQSTFRAIPVQFQCNFRAVFN